MRTEKDNSDGIIEVHDQSGEQFAAVWNWLLDRHDLSICEKMVWIALKSYAGYQEIRPSVQKVARRASVSVRTAQRSISALSEKELIRVERRSRPDGGFATNRYILLPASKNNKIKRVGDTVAPTPPGAMATPAPGDSMSPPQAPQCHHKEYIKKIIINKTTTGVVIFNDIKKIVAHSPFQKIDEGSLTMFVKKYGVKLVFDALDMLVQTYKQSGKSVNDPTAVLGSGLLKGVIPPAGYVPYQERIENERKAKELGEQKRLAYACKRKKEKEAYNEKTAEFLSLSQQDQEKWLSRAMAEMHPSLRSSKIAVKSMAMELFRGS